MASQQIHPDPVPRPAALVRDFVNTLDHELGTDALDTSEGFAAFLSEHELLLGPALVSEAQRAMGVRLRRALHDALELNRAGARDPLPDFDAILAEYRRAPAVTRQRLYTETMERILRNSNKVGIDTPKGGTAPIVLPPDLLRSRSATPPAAPAPVNGASQGQEAAR